MIVITGKSCSGKDSIANELIKLGMKRLITYTTRPPRQDEINGVTYHFIPKKQFKTLELHGYFAESYSYEVANGDIWYYGSAQKDYIGNKFIILTPKGLETIKERGLDVISFYISADDDMIKERMNSRGDDKKESERRLKSDKKDFEHIEDLVNFTILNNGTLSLKQIAELIKEAAIGKEKN